MGKDLKTTYLVGFSGPPRSGKDTLGGLVADILREKGITVEVHALSLPMRLAVYGLLGLEYSVEHYEKEKDREFATQDGRRTTIRKEMISLSEDHVKPRLGHGWWAYALLNRTRLRNGVIIVTDMGFDAEHDVFSNEIFGSAHCAWIHLHREGTDFSNDSRSYVGKGCHIHNDDDPMTEARRIYGRLVNQYHWSL
jgi:hypothetical protein